MASFPREDNRVPIIGGLSTVDFTTPKAFTLVPIASANMNALTVMVVDGSGNYLSPANYVNGVTAAITDTTSTQVIAANASSRIYVTSLLVTNSHATVGTFVKILDGSTLMYEGYAAAAGGGFSTPLPVPLKGTANTALNAQCVTTGANVIVSAAGYTGA